MHNTSNKTTIHYDKKKWSPPYCFAYIVHFPVPLSFLRVMAGSLKEQQASVQQFVSCELEVSRNMVYSIFTFLYGETLRRKWSDCSPAGDKHKPHPLDLSV